MTVAVFSYAGFIARYPEFTATVSEPLASLLFSQAGLYLSNDDCSVVPCDAVTYEPRLMLLDMIVAHLAMISVGNGSGASGLVGRVSSATQGSVSVSVEMAAAKNGAWWNQTPYGAAYWQATLPYRMFRYIAAPEYCGGLYGHPWRR